MNQGSKPVTYTIALPVAAGPGEEFYTGRKSAAGESVTCALEPGDAAAFVLRR
jgi:hypothetical protein